MVGAAQGLREPVAQCLLLASLGHMRGYNRLFASLKRAVEIGGDNNVFGDETPDIERIA